MLAADRNAGRMNLRVTRIRKERALLVGAPGRGDVAAFGVGRKEENVSITAGRQDHGIRGMGGNFAGDQIAHDDAFGVAIDHHDIEHFRARKHLHCAEADLPARAPGKRRAAVAGRSGRARKTCAKPARRRRSDWPASRHIRAQTERLARRIGR